MIIKIEGMMCENCAARVKTVLEKIPGVSAAVDVKAKQADVSAPEGVSFEQLKTAIENAGYDVVD